MDLKDKILKNLYVTLTADIISKALSFIIVVFIARLLSEEGLGIYSYIFSLGFFFIIFSDLGIVRYIVREIAKDKSKTDKYFNNFITLKLILSFIILIIHMIVVYFIAPAPGVYLSSVLAMIIIIVENIDLTFQNVFIAYEELKDKAFIVLTERILSLIGGVIILLLFKNLNLLLLALLVSRSITILIEARIINTKYFRLHLYWDVKLWFFLIKRSLPFWLTKIFEVIYTRTDVLMLTYLASFSFVGYYSAATKIIEPIMLVSTVMIITIYPTMSRLSSESKKLLRRIFEKAFHYTLALVLPISIIIAFGSEFIINKVYGEAFRNSIYVLKIGAWSAVFMFLIAILGHSLNSINKEKVFSLAVGLAAGANVVLNLILIKEYQHVGAAIATLITQFICFVVLYIVAFKEKLKVNLKMAFRVIIPAFLTIGLVFLVNKNILFVLMSPIVYILLTYLFNGIYHEEKTLIKEFLHINK